MSTTLLLALLTACGPSIDAPLGLGPAAPKSLASSTVISGYTPGWATLVATVNGGSYDDLIHIDATTGAIRVHHGRVVGPSSTPTSTLTATVGDGAVAAGAGDVNGDGYNDVVVGDGTYGTGHGRILAYHGSRSGLRVRSTTQISGSAGSRLGEEVLGLGDVNGDGYDDIAASMMGRDRVRVYYGSSTGLGASYTTLSASWHDASAVTWDGSSTTHRGLGAADVNGDGYADLTISYPTWNSDDGGFYVFFGAASGIGTTGTLVEHPYAGFESSWCYGPPHLGWALQGGDFDGDGFGDMAASAPEDVCYGYVYVWYGGRAGLDESTWVEFMGYGSDVYNLGHSLGAGDFDGNGSDDLAFGGWYQVGYAESGTWDFSDSSNELANYAMAFTSTSEPYDFGYVNGRGDVDGDGNDDVVYWDDYGNLWMFAGG